MKEGLESKTFKVRRATHQDADAVAKLSAELGYPTAHETMRDRIHAISASPSDLLLVAVDLSDEPIGWLQAHAAQLLESGFRVEIVGMIVTTAMRRQGVGRTLVAGAERWARTIRAPAIVVRSNIQRTGSHAFYPELGFATTKTQHVYRKSLTDGTGS